MNIQNYVKQAQQEGIAQAFVIYANIGNNTDELIVCSAQDADNAGAEIKDITFIEHNQFYRTAVITAEVA